jgi:tripartite-type tricarboxylate transporter receptor subunit TctC
MNGGKVKPLMVTSPNRLEVLPDVPTAAEAGFPRLVMGSVYGILAPAGTSSTVVNRMNAEIIRIIELPDVKKRFQTLGIEPNPSNPADAVTTVSRELATWSRAIKDANITR